MRFFGLEITRKNGVVNTDKNLDGVATPEPDGALDIYNMPGAPDGMANSYYFDFNFAAKEDKDLIGRYRETARIADCDDAIDEIVNEAIIVQDQEAIIEIMLDNTNFSDGIKKKIVTEFDYLLGLLNFHDNGDQIFRQWYIDGRHYYHKVVDSSDQKKGIQELNWLDPIKTKKVREIERKTVQVDGKSVELNQVKREYFFYDPTLNVAGNPGISFHVSPAQNVLQLTPESVAFITSGKVDLETGQVHSYMHNAVKPANQLSLLEDSMVVYRLTRAPERRIFYIDIGSLGSSRAEQYVRGIMNKYRNKLVYDVKTGSVEANKAHLSMMEDIWLPRKEGGRGTEVDTLPAGANLGDIEDVLYFKRRLVKAMKIPVSRMDAEGALFNIGISGEVSRDELKFTKYVDKIRRRFNTFFYDLLWTQLTLKNIVTEEDWNTNRHKIGFIYNRDSYIAELQKSEMWRQRLDLLTAAKDYIGKDRYFSQRWMKDNILMLSEEDRRQIEKDWKTEPEPEPVGGADGFGGDEPTTPAKRPSSPPIAGTPGTGSELTAPDKGQD